MPAYSTGMNLITADPEILAKRDVLISRLEHLVPRDCLLCHKDQLRAYEADAQTMHKQVPMAVVLPETTEQVSAVMALCNELGIKVVPRGAGTGLSGGAVPLEDGVIVGLAKFNKNVDVD
jgi:glycolate oxidase